MLGVTFGYRLDAVDAGHLYATWKRDFLLLIKSATTLQLYSVNVIIYKKTKRSVKNGDIWQYIYDAEGPQLHGQQQH